MWADHASFAVRRNAIRSDMSPLMASRYAPLRLVSQRPLARASRPGSSSRRIEPMYLWMMLTALPGGSCPHRRSMMSSMETS